eukprot:CAMPEP_0195152720 /NCGR_PEP_ID=MMETSP0448-20130528/182792_1 /TAXON_ID=66468 /ORGANISM="Heterocapsa triquestra, Strain CCMP 448" /LENGTH=92 /DNA_ID=CAMNT_0040191485 /DNA_START=331 /DNA_END=611 /DNA_ORIENTATION=+
MDSFLRSGSVKKKPAPVEAPTTAPATAPVSSKSGKKKSMKMSKKKAKAAAESVRSTAQTLEVRLLRANATLKGTSQRGAQLAGMMPLHHHLH